MEEFVVLEACDGRTRYTVGVFIDDLRRDGERPFTRLLR